MQSAKDHRAHLIPDYDPISATADYDEQRKKEEEELLRDKDRLMKMGDSENVGEDGDVEDKAMDVEDGSFPLFSMLHFSFSLFLSSCSIFSSDGEVTEAKEKAKITKWLAKELKDADSHLLPLKGEAAAQVTPSYLPPSPLP